MDPNSFIFPPPPPPPASSSFNSQSYDHNGPSSRSRGQRGGERNRPPRGNSRGQWRGSAGRGSNSQPLGIRPTYGSQQRQRDPQGGRPHCSGSVQQQTNSNGYGYDPGMRGSSANYAGPVQKRTHAEAFKNSDRGRPTPSFVAPAVPSFGGPPPFFSPPPIVKAVQKPAPKIPKPPKANNSLGLTPAGGDTFSSEEEDGDIDEEAQLAAATVEGSHKVEKLILEYKGQNFHLQNPADISKWIEQRRKNYPTHARHAEANARKLELAAAKEKLSQAKKEAKQKQNAEGQVAKPKKRTNGAAGKARHEGGDDSAAESRRKIEKLRKKLEKEERKASKAQSWIAEEDKTNSSDALGNQLTQEERQGGIKAAEHRQRDMLQDLPKLQNIRPPDAALTSDAHPSRPSTSNEPGHLLKPATTAAIPTTNVNPSSAVPDEFSSLSDTSLSDSSSDLSSTESDESTSSSGCSSSDEAPEQAPSKKPSGIKAQPKKQEPPPRICNQFRRSGQCRKGDKCDFVHARSKRAARSGKPKNTGTEKQREKQEQSTGRISLYQRLVQQEKEKEAQEEGRKGLEGIDGPT